MTEPEKRITARDHFALVAKVERLDERLSGADKALILASDADKVQFHNLNDLRKDVEKDREEFVRKEVFQKELDIVRGFVARQIAVWTMVAGAGIGTMLLVLKILGK